MWRGAGPFWPARVLGEWLDAAGITEAVRSAVPKGGKHIGDTLGARAYYDFIKSGMLDWPRREELPWPLNALWRDFDRGTQRRLGVKDEGKYLGHESADVWPASPRGPTVPSRDPAGDGAHGRGVGAACLMAATKWRMEGAV
jgi:hypothetical protein